MAKTRDMTEKDALKRLVEDDLRIMEKTEKTEKTRKRRVRS